MKVLFIDSDDYAVTAAEIVFASYANELTNDVCVPGMYMSTTDNREIGIRNISKAETDVLVEELFTTGKLDLRNRNVELL